MLNKYLLNSQMDESDLSPEWLLLRHPHSNDRHTSKETPPSLSFQVCMRAEPLGQVRLFATPRTIAHQAPLSMGFPKQEYWRGLLFSSPGELPNSGIEPSLLHWWVSFFVCLFLPLNHLGSPWATREVPKLVLIN